MPTLQEYLAMMQPQEPSQREKIMSALGAMGVGLLSAPSWQKGLARGGLLAYDAQQNAKDRSAQDSIARLRQYQAAQQMADTDAQREKQAALDKAAAGAFMPGRPGSPQMGPPTAQGDMQPAVPAQAPGFDYAKYLATVAPIDPQRAMQVEQAMRPKAEESPFAKIDPSKFTPESLAQFAATKNHGVLRPVEAQKDQWEVVGRTPEGQTIQRNKTTGQLQAVGSPASRTTVNMPPIEKEEDKFIGKSRGEAFVSINKAGYDANQRLAKLEMLDRTLTGVDTSGLTPIGMKVASAARGLGINIDANLPAKEAAQAISNEMALQMRNPAGGAGMPGAMSDADREFLLNSVPNLSQTPQGRAMLIEVQKRLAKRDQEVAALAREYRGKVGKFDEGFDDFLRSRINGSLFADLMPRSKSGVIGAPTAPGSVIKFDANGNQL